MNRITAACLVLAASLYGCERPHDVGQQTNAAAESSWRFQTLKDAMTDKVRGIASLESRDGASTGALLIFKCDEPGPNSVYVQISFGQYLGATHERSETRDVQYRIDGGTPGRLTSEYDDKYLLVTDPGDVKRFAAAVANGKRLAVRAKTFQYSAVDTEFDLSDAPPHIRRVAETCNATPLI
ncbi:hypothetical protein DF027_21155 [Burkholderia cenocepacia]|uniref:hypothetical protein n=1 Tax=Burkholderia cenocepacia TaxID=95486 RepID=UPI000F56DE21|nr:hypothetical protein [Burkholderia cenocepacia]RQV39101.1 hypothetical protein DF027_21155 [Burkholderia cenocepacia]RQV41167.1 hypothetical protein DF028_14050 [Burkholderia cenocepacia]RQV78023.1 hypothetical protein DF010_14455 [Burkholderia cenocepacia]